MTKMADKWKFAGEVGAPDSKNRVVLTPGLTTGERVDGFNVFLNDSGEIKLEPVVKIPAKEAWLYKNSEALASVDRGIKDALAGRVAPLSRARLKKKNK